MPNNQTKKLAQGAMMAAVFAVLIAIGYYVPVLLVVTTLIAPLPIAWYSASYERSQAISMTIVAIAITFFLGGLLILGELENPQDYSTYFMKIESAKFKRKVVPGDTLVFKVELLEPIRRGIVHMHGYGYIGNQIAVEAEMMAVITKE